MLQSWCDNHRDLTNAPMFLSTAIIENLVTEFQARRWQSEPMSKAMHIAWHHPEAVKDLALAVMRALPEGGTFLDAALSFLPEEDWPQIIEKAVAALEADDHNEAAEAVTSYASLQCLPAVHPHLERLFHIDTLFQSYSGVYAWRESGIQHFTTLRQHLEQSVSPSDTASSHYRRSYGDKRLRAWQAMLETRCPEVLEFAFSSAGTLHLTPDEVRAYSHQVGYEVREGAAQSLYSNTVFHLAFPEGFLPLRPDFQASHPTWHFQGTGPLLRFGGGCPGVKCSVCGETVHHLLTLAPIPEVIGVSGLPSLTLATCLSCLGWEVSPLFYAHGADGTPRPLESAVEPHAPQFPSPPLQETTVRLAKTPPRWRWQDWGLSNGRESLHRIGGHPCWIQDAEYPACPHCRQTMHFLLQLDSELPLQSGEGGPIEDTMDVIEWGSGGIAYGFWCDSCRVSGFLWQCT